MLNNLEEKQIRENNFLSSPQGILTTGLPGKVGSVTQPPIVDGWRGLPTFGAQWAACSTRMLGQQLEEGGWQAVSAAQRPHVEYMEPSAAVWSVSLLPSATAVKYAEGKMILAGHLPQVICQEGLPAE